MGELIYRLMNSDIVLYVLYFALALLFVVFLVYALSKEGRDEHGRAILGTAYIYGAIALPSWWQMWLSSSCGRCAEKTKRGENWYAGSADRAI